MKNLKVGKSYSISGNQVGIGRHFNCSKEILITSQVGDYYNWTSSNGCSGRFGNDSEVSHSTQFVELEEESQPLIFN